MIAGHISALSIQMLLALLLCAPHCGSHRVLCALEGIYALLLSQSCMKWFALPLL